MPTSTPILRLDRLFPEVLRKTLAGVATGALMGGSILMLGCACPTSISNEQTPEAAVMEQLRQIQEDQGYLGKADCAPACPSSFDGEPLWGCEFVAGAEPSQSFIDCIYGGDPECVAGRRFGPCETLAGRGAPDPSARWFARMAALEAEAVHAFAALARELRHHGAPRPLVAAASRALADERRHVRMMRAAARRRGATPQAVRAAPAAVRPLHEIALDNAVEGCVREAYGALQMHFLARSPDPEVAGLASAIAADETRHAELSWRLHAWLLQRLPAGHRRHLDAAMASAWADLEDAAATPVAEALTTDPGLPTPEVATQMVRELRAALAA